MENENVTIPELAQITKTKVSYLYEQSRHNRIPGQFRLGKFVRINLPTFYEKTGLDRRFGQQVHRSTCVSV